MGTLIRLLLAGVISLISVFSYCSQSSDNPVTGEKQRVSITYEEEALLGRQAAGQMAERFGGISVDPAGQAVKEVGAELVQSVAKELPYSFEFHLLADRETVNAFALPGGQVFLTEGLLAQLKTRGQLAGVLAHEVAHVVARHGAERLAKQQLTQGLTGAAVLASYDPSNPSSAQRAQMSQLVAGLMSMRYGRADELEADEWGVKLSTEAGYDPRALVDVMDILEKASARGYTPELFSTHPNPENRRQRISEAITALYPQGLPKDLEP